MASFQLDENQSTYQIRSYQPGMIQINTERYTQSLIITPHQLITDWPPQTIKELSNISLAPIIALKPDILLIGTGEQLIFIPIDLYGNLLNLKIGVEIMDTRAACRTYSALSAEGRNVAAALIIPKSL